MKKLISILISIAAVLSLCSCTSGTQQKTDGLSIVCTAFPQYDFAKNVMGSDENIILLVKDGSDLHSYEPTAQDMVKINNADLFIYVGGVSDSWVDKVLNASNNKKAKTLSMLECCETLLTQSECHEHEGEEEHDISEIDEHVWLSIENAVSITEAIKDALCEIDGENSEKYEKNTKEFLQQLSLLDKDFQKLADNKKPVLFADRFPFAYLMDEYNIKYYAAFSGCSSEASASFETIAALIETIKENKLRNVIIIEGSDGSIAKALANETGVEAMTMNSCQSVTSKDIENGVTYLDIMHTNFEVLSQAIS